VKPAFPAEQRLLAEQRPESPPRGSPLDQRWRGRVRTALVLLADHGETARGPNPVAIKTPHL